MKKHQKKQYRPIAGQRWYETLLDWITQEENFGWCIVGIFAYVILLAFGGHILANIMKLPDIADVFMKVWFSLFPVVTVPAMTNPLSGFWEIRTEKKLQESIREYIEEHGRCTYDELVVQCMPIKIHLGIDSAIERMLQQHDLTLDTDNHYRFPTDEERKKWREQWLEEDGVKISFEDLESIFALNLKESEESIDIEFSLGEHDGYWMGKTEENVSGEDIFWLMVGLGDRLEFTTFQEMTEAKLFDGQSLEAVWDCVTLTFINDHDMVFWLEEHLPSCD